MAGKLKLSVIIPTLNEEKNIVSLLKSLRSSDHEQLEIIVVDGGSTDQTCSSAAQYADLVLHTTPGRSRQLNLGAKYATGEVLWFLHADSQINQDCLAQIVQAVANGYQGGCFTLKFDSPEVIFRAITWGSNLRAKLIKSFYGDQAIFVTKALFNRLGGFPSLPIMEDLEFSRRLKRAAAVTVLPSTVVTSSRRFKAGGVIRTLLLMQFLKLGYHLKVNPQTLAEIYRDHKKFTRLRTGSAS